MANMDPNDFYEEDEHPLMASPIDPRLICCAPGGGVAGVAAPGNTGLGAP